MADSNGVGTASGNLKRARSSSPVNGEAGSSGANAGKKHNPGPGARTVDLDAARAAAPAKQASGGVMATPGSAIPSEEGAVPEESRQAVSSLPTTLPNDLPVPTGVPEAGASGSAGLAAAPAADAATPTISIRALIVTQDASIIIGKGGSHIKEIRERAGAKVSVSEQAPGNAERILYVTGPLDAVSKAYGLIVRKINDEPYDQPSVPGSRAVTIKYIVPNNRMGSIIGKGGAKIKEIQEASGARLQASEHMLPGSTERILSVSGVADAVHIAVYYVGTILQENQERAAQNTPYRPAAAGYAGAGGAPGGYPAQGSRYPPAGGPGGYYGGAPQGYGGYGGQPIPAQLAGNPYATPSTAAAPGSQTQQIYIPSDLVGNIIGKGGQKINEIRQMSGCSIKITEPTEAQGSGARANERLVTINGLPQNIQTAVQMLHTRLEQEKARKMQQGGY